LAGFFYQLGKKVAPNVRKARWVWQSVFGSEAEMIATEIEVGRGLAQEVLAQMPCCCDKDTQAFVSSIGAKLVERLKEKRRPFVVTVVDDPKPNAFALPGGYVFITRSILELCAMEPAQVAFVVAHEMAHITKGHTMERIALGSAVSFASNLAAVRGAMVGWARKAGVDALQSVYSREHELEADALAVALIQAAGYDPTGGERLLSGLANQCPNSDATGLDKYFSSHPASSVRIAEIRRFLASR
jgi:predicted Zn-dependent protease